MKFIYYLPLFFIGLFTKAQTLVGLGGAKYGALDKTWGATAHIKKFIKYNIPLGLEFNTFSSQVFTEQADSYNKNNQFNNQSLLLTINYFVFDGGLNPYIGGAVGGINYKYRYNLYNPSNNAEIFNKTKTNLFLLAHVKFGARYDITKHLGLWGEAKYNAIFASSKTISENYNNNTYNFGYAQNHWGFDIGIYLKLGKEKD